LASSHLPNSSRRRKRMKGNNDVGKIALLPYEGQLQKCRKDTK
jgi:hypothetical protein